MKLDFQKSYGCDYPALSGYDLDLGRIKTTGFWLEIDFNLVPFSDRLSASMSFDQRMGLFFNWNYFVWNGAGLWGDLVHMSENQVNQLNIETTLRWPN